MRVLSNQEMGDVAGGWFWCWWGYRSSCSTTTTNTCNTKPTCDPKPTCEPKPTCDPKPDCGSTTPTEPPQVP